MDFVGFSTVFPACAGMNRRCTGLSDCRHCVPRMRGDEPDYKAWKRAFGKVFPACAGMNRMILVDPSDAASVPRMRGDEPREHD